MNSRDARAQRCRDAHTPSRRDRPAHDGSPRRVRSRLGARRRRRRSSPSGRSRSSTPTHAPPAPRSSTRTDHAVLPGLHNCHLHSGLLRGTAESMSLWDWLEAYVDPAHKALTPEIARGRVAAVLRRERCSRARRRSWTCGGSWRARPASPRQLGIRATLVPYVADERGLRLLRDASSRNRRLLEIAPHRGRRPGAHVGRARAPLLLHARSASAAAVELAEEFDTGLHTHSSESIWEVAGVAEAVRAPARSRCSTTAGILGPRTVVAHCVWLDDREIELLAQTGTSVAHCPCSNMKLSSGPARVGDLRARGDRGRARQRRREGEQQPRPRRGDEVRVAAAEGDDARPDDRRPVGRPRDGHDRRRRAPSGSTTSPARSSRASGPTSSRSTSTGCTPRRCCTARLQRRRPPRVLGVRAATCATCGSTAGGSWTRRDADDVRRRDRRARPRQAAAEELFERRAQLRS